MSFKCEVCRETQNHGVKANKQVVEIRKVTYPTVKKKDGNIVIPEGFETVRELDVCPECSNKDYRVKVVGEKVIS